MRTPWIKYGSTRKACPSDSLLLDIASKIGFRLPPDYRRFAAEYTGLSGEIGPRYAVIHDAEELLDVHTANFISTDLPYSLEIGSNGSSELIVLRQLSEDNFGIFLIPSLDLAEVATHIPIGDSFTDFLDRLENGREWFN